MLEFKNENSKMKIIFSFLFAIVLTAGTFAQKPIFAEAKTNSATVYYNGAEMQQKASLSLPSGTSEVVIKNVANQLLENSIQIGSPSSVSVMSVQFTTDYISEYDTDERPEIARYFSLLCSSKIR